MLRFALFLEIIVAVALSVWLHKDGARRKPMPEQGAIIGGVCVGLAEHFGLPLNAVRIVFIAASLVGFGAVAYLVMCFVLGDDRELTNTNNTEVRTRQ
jgi:phage shock protein PspC (stress-responsive transcriptional regulator)